MLEKNKILSWMEATLLESKKNQFTGVGSDTRKDLHGKLFFALRGDAFDAHDFLEKAIDQGADAIVIDKKEKFEELKKNNKTVTTFLVNDTLLALQNLAHHYRKQLGTKIVSITGSNGKTTSKEFTAQVLESFFNTHFNAGSFNNHWGVPFSLLELKPEHQVGIIEMGMNHVHEIETLVKIATPDIVVCTMVGNAHIEHFGSIDKIAEAKQEIYQFSDPAGIRIFNLDNPLTKKMYEKFGLNHKQTYTFSELNLQANVCLRVIDFTIDGLTIDGVIGGVKNKIKVPVFGTQNITNIMVAATVALALKANPEKIWEVLKKIKTNWGRNQFVQSDKGSKILFDGYNANPDSMKSLLENFAKLKPTGKKIAVFAEMLELGNLSDEFHKNIGKQAASSGFDYIFFYGKPCQAFAQGVALAQATMSAQTATPCFVYPEFNQEIITKIQNLESADSLICVKGSRGMKTEKVVQGLVKTFPSK